MNFDMDLFDLSEPSRKLWNLEDYPHACLYYDLAYQAVVEGDIDLAMAYFSKTLAALQNGSALTVLNGKKPLGESYDGNKRGVLRIVP
jgi:hypothetical protein